MYSEHSIQFAKQKVEEQKKKEKLNQFYSSRDIMALDPQLQTAARQAGGTELLGDMANLTWVDDVDLGDVDDPAEQASGETKDNRNKTQRNSNQFDEESRLKELNHLINESRGDTKSGSKGVEDAEFRKRDSYRQIQSRALNKQMQDDLVSNKEEGDRIGKQAPTWVVAEMQT